MGVERIKPKGNADEEAGLEKPELPIRNPSGTSLEMMVTSAAIHKQ